MNTDEARAALAKLDDAIENVCLECGNALKSYQRAQRLREEGKYTDEDVEHERIQAWFALDILKALGYKVDYYFFDTPILKAVD